MARAAEQMGAFSIATRQQGEVVRERNRALAEALERQTVTSETLRALSQSQTDLTAVCDAIIRSAVRLCNGDVGSVYRYDGEMIHRVILTRAVVHVPDVLADPDLGFHAVARGVGFRGYLGVPLLLDGEPRSPCATPSCSARFRPA